MHTALLNPKRFAPFVKDPKATCNARGILDHLELPFFQVMLYMSKVESYRNALALGDCVFTFLVFLGFRLEGAYDEIWRHNLAIR